MSPIEPPPADKPWLKRWRVSLGEPGAEPVETVFDFLEWQDLIPRRKPFRAVRMSLAGIVTFFAMLRRGIYFKMARYAKSHGGLGIFPFGMLLLYLWIMATLVWAGFTIAEPYGPVATALGTAVGAILAAAFYRLTVRFDGILFVWFAIALWNFQWHHGEPRQPRRRSPLRRLCRACPRAAERPELRRGGRGGGEHRRLLRDRNARPHARTRSAARRAQGRIPDPRRPAFGDLVVRSARELRQGNLGGAEEPRHRMDRLHDPRRHHDGCALRPDPRRRPRPEDGRGRTGSSTTASTSSACFRRRACRRCAGNSSGCTCTT